MIRRLCRTAAALTAALLVGACAHAEKFDFVAVGDMPYGPREKAWPPYKNLIARQMFFAKPTTLGKQPFANAKDKLIPNVVRLEVFGAPDVHAVRVRVNTEDPDLFSFALLFNPMSPKP